MKTYVGMLSWNSPDKLDRAITSVRQMTTGDWSLLIVDNCSTDPGVMEVLDRHTAEGEGKITVYHSPKNTGYAGGVNHLLRQAYIGIEDSHYMAYVENDCYIQTRGWNESMIEVMERHHEIGIIHPGTYINMPISRNGYTEILWGVGCMWMLNTARLKDVGYLDEEIGHQQEADYALRMRLAGWKVAADESVRILHDANATSNPASQERITQGVIDWVNKWNKYFHGPQINYFSPNVTRWEDWNALYLEEYHRQFLPADLNSNPETVMMHGQEYDLIKIPKWKWLYRDRLV